MKYGITVHTVVKNEEKWIWFSIKSVIDYVDKIIIFDTGSTDNTVKIIENLALEYKNKIVFERFDNIKDEDFSRTRQKQIDITDTLWFLILDGDEIWYKKSIEELSDIIRENNCDMVATRFYNCAGDVFHLKKYDSEHYKIKNETGSITIRAYSKNIEGINCKNKYGIEGFFDLNNKPVQDNSERIIIQKGYFFHTSYTQRSSSLTRDREIEYRRKKLFSSYDYKAGKDFAFPEVFYLNRPGYVADPFEKMSLSRKIFMFLLKLKTKLSK